MPKIAYQDIKFRGDSLALIQQADRIATEYANQGYDLTLRQLFYQFVARGIIPNKDTEYKRLGSLVMDGRMCGMIDWNHITDRTRNLASLSHWSTPGDIIDSAAYGYRLDKWKGQPYRPEVWVEKEALAGVIGRAAEALDVPYFSCRGYVSISEMWGAAKRLIRHLRNGQTPYIIHLGDHDPSGIDMTRDIMDRLQLFLEHEGFSAAQVDRIALNWDQIEEYTPPPNPAKSTDARFKAYLERFGEESWELDALEPSVLDELITDKLLSLRDDDAWEQVEGQEGQEKEQLRAIAKRWPEVIERMGVAIRPKPADDLDEEISRLEDEVAEAAAAADDGPDYPYIRAWGRSRFWSDAAIEEEVAKARFVQAPADTLYSTSEYDDEGNEKWYRLAYVEDAETRSALERYAAIERVTAGQHAETEAAHKPSGHYPYIRAYGAYLSHSDEEIEATVEAARHDEAPQRTFRRFNARWQTLEDIEETQPAMYEWLEEWVTNG